MKLDELKFNEVIALYKMKNQYQKEGKLVELIQLKNLCPELFNKETEMEITGLLNTVNYVASTPRFQALREKEEKKKYIQVDYQNWQSGMLAKVAQKYSRFDISNMDVLSREMVKEAIIGCWDILRLQENKLISIDRVFPYLGYLLGEIICQLPLDKRQHKINLTVFKLCGQQMEMNEVTSSNKQPTLSKTEKNIRNYFQTLVQLVSQKFDQRKDFYSDAMFFFLMETAEFIGLLIPHMGIDDKLNINDVITGIYHHMKIRVKTYT